MPLRTLSHIFCALGFFFFTSPPLYTKIETNGSLLCILGASSYKDNKGCFMDNKVKKGTLLVLCFNILLMVALIAALVYLAFGTNNGTETAGGRLPAQEDAAEVMGAATDEAAELQAWIDNMKVLAEKHGVDAYFLQELFPENIVYSFRGEHIYAQLDSSLPQHSYQWDKLSRGEDGILRYAEEGALQGLVGIDVSKYQGDIDWQKVKEAGVQFTFLRAGYRGYESGEIMEDENFKTYLDGASAVGMPLGLYFFSQAVTAEEAVQEADYLVDLVAGYNIQYPIVFDMEEVETSPYRTENLTATQVTDIALAFCERISKRGYTPMIYGNVSWFLSRMELNRLAEVDKWFAQYRPMPYYPYDFTIWQYTHKGRIDGIEGDVDLNISFVDYAAA